MAEIAFTGVLASRAWRPRRWASAGRSGYAIAAAAVAAAAFEIYVLYLARSAGAIIALGLG